MSNPVVLVVGAGPGVGTAVARRYARDGYDVALVARDGDRLDRLGAELQADGVTAGWRAVDIADAGAFAAAVTRFGEHSGRLDVVHFNPSVFRRRDPLSLTPADLLADLSVGVAPVLTMVQAALPFLSHGGRVTATGSMAADRPWHEAASLGVQKAALRNLFRSLDKAVSPHGVRAVSVTVNGTLAAGTAFDPERVADAVHAAAARPDDDTWTSEVAYDG